jgi:hypothetical protein
MENIPLFYLVLSKEHLEKAMEEFIPDRLKKLKYEERVFKYFISSIEAQIAILKLDESKLDFYFRMIHLRKEVRNSEM